MIRFVKMSEKTYKNMRESPTIQPSENLCYRRRIKVLDIFSNVLFKLDPYDNP